MTKPYKPNTFALRTLKQRRDRRKNLQDQSKLEIALQDLVARTRAVTGVIARRDKLSPEEEHKARQALINGVVERFASECGVTLTLDSKPLPEPVRGPWKAATLKRDHIRRYGYRKCIICGEEPKVGQEVNYCDGSADIKHLNCEDSKPTESQWRVYMYSKKHDEKRPGATCLRCKEPVMVGQSVAWKVGSRGVYHEACRPEEK